MSHVQFPIEQSWDRTPHSNATDLANHASEIVNLMTRIIIISLFAITPLQVLAIQRKKKKKKKKKKRTVKEHTTKYKATKLRTV